MDHSFNRERRRGNDRRPAGIPGGDPHEHGQKNRLIPSCDHIPRDLHGAMVPRCRGLAKYLTAFVTALESANIRSQLPDTGFQIPPPTLMASDDCRGIWHAASGIRYQVSGGVGGRQV